MIENTVIRPANQDKYNDVSKKITKVINKSLDVTSTFKEDNQRFKRSIIKTNTGNITASILAIKSPSVLSVATFRYCTLC